MVEGDLDHAAKLGQVDPIEVLDLPDREQARLSGPVEPVPVLVELDRQPLEILEPQPERERSGEQRLVIGVGEEPVDETAPAFVEVDGRRHRIAHLEARRQAGFERELDEDPQGEAVERADGRIIDGVERIEATSRPIGPPCRLAGRGGCSRREGLPLEAPADAVAQLRGRLLGEGDGGELADVVEASRGHQLDHPTDQLVGLARARPGFDEQARPALGADAAAVGPVVDDRRHGGCADGAIGADAHGGDGWGRGHGASTSGVTSGPSASSRYASSSGARRHALPLLGSRRRADPVEVAEAAVLEARRSRPHRVGPGTTPARCPRR